MVMHGSSSVPQELVDRINAAGGKLEATYGVPVEEIQQGIRHGVRKVNVDTDGRLAITAALREALNANPSEFDPRAFFKPARAAMKEVVAAADDATSAPPATPATTPCSRSTRWRRCMRGAPSVPEPGPRPARDQHDPHADGRRRPGRAVRATRARRSALAPDRVPPLHAGDEAQPRRPDVAGPRPLRALGRATRRCCSTRACTSRATTSALDEIKQFRQLGSHTPGHPENFDDAGRRDDHRPARPGVRERRRDGDGGEVPAREVRRRGLRPPHLRDLLRRRPDGGRRLRGGLARRPPAPRAARLPLRRQRDHDRRPDEPRRSRPRTCRSASRPTAGTRSRSRTATTSRRSRPRSAPGWPRRSGRR